MSRRKVAAINGARVLSIDDLTTGMEVTIVARAMTWRKPSGTVQPVGRWPASGRILKLGKRSLTLAVSGTFRANILYADIETINAGHVPAIIDEVLG